MSLKRGYLTNTVIVSTASPFKFNESVAKSILGFEKTIGKTEFEYSKFNLKRTWTKNSRFIGKFR